jgi:hypothetical protein
MPLDVTLVIPDDLFVRAKQFTEVGKEKSTDELVL